MDSASARAAVYEALFDEDARDRPARLVHATLVVTIITSIVATVLDTEPVLHDRWASTFAVIEHVCVWLFTIEYGLRAWVAVDDRAGRYEEPLRGRLRYLLTPLAVIDLLAILPYWLAFLIPADLVVLRTLRLLRLAKLARHSAALDTLEIVLMNERRSLTAVLGLIGVLLVIAATLMYNFEGAVQPAGFGSIPRAMWWAVMTLTTVGYGDVTPVTAGGRMLAGLVALLGIGVLALPTAIIGAGFLHEMQKRNFAATAGMVARVPLFEHLTPAQLAEVTGLLRPRRLPPRFTVLRKGEPGDAMYFIDEGQLVVRTGTNRLVLGAGSYVGEMALLKGGARTATVVTLRSCKLLELSAHDFHRLLGSDERLRSVMVKEARRRDAALAGDAGSMNEEETS